MIGITGYGGYVPRLRLPLQLAAQANAWYAPQFARRTGRLAFGNWDEDSVTMAVAAARDCLGPLEDRNDVRALWLASTTLPFAERLNAAVAAGALRLDEDIQASDVGGSQRCALGALEQGLNHVRVHQEDVLVLAAESRRARPASAQELDYGDGAAALRLGTRGVLAELLGSARRTVDFVDRFRATDRDIDYHWEERWVRDEGILPMVPPVVQQALRQAGIDASAVHHFIFPSSLRNMAQTVAARCGIAEAAVADDLMNQTGDVGCAHALLMLAHVLEGAEPDQIIVMAQFGSGAQAMVLRTTTEVKQFRPVQGVSGWLERGVDETNYTRFLSFKGQIDLERGMRGEQDRKTALSTAWRHRRALQGLVAGRCTETGSVHFPPARLSFDQPPRLDTQEPYPLADRPAYILSWSAEYLSWHPSPPHHYGQIDFEGGGRILMDFTDIDVGEVDTGLPVELVFRIKDFDDLRGYRRYFWKATPVRRGEAQGGQHGKRHQG